MKVSHVSPGTIELLFLFPKNLKLHYSTCHEVLEDGASHKVSKVVSWTVDLCKHSRDF